MGKKSEYQKEIVKASDGSTNVDIELDAVPMGYKRTIQNISCEDETTGLTEIRIGYKTRFDRYHWWIEQESPQAGVLYWTDSTKILQEGAVLVIRFTGSTNLDVLAAYVDGYTEKVS